ncbi:MAG: alpha/beta hydrolase [Actinomycetes bacterium]
MSVGLFWGVRRCAVLGLPAIVLMLAGCSTASSPAVVVPSTSVSVQAPVDLAEFYRQPLTWHDCGGPECARINVPLDYSDPTAATISISLSRTKATGTPVGSLFVDPGGPGGSATDYAKAAEAILDPDVLAAYDVVGMDPRGVGGSTGVHCLTDKQIDLLAATDTTPADSAAETKAEAVAKLPAVGCGKDPVALHVSTEDVARDLDIVRALVGDPVLNYFGKSYGSMLGITYAQLFPANVGRMVLDGILPPDLDLVEVTKGQADAFEVSVRDFVTYCLAQSDCPLTGTVDQALAQLRAWLTGLDAHPLAGGDRPLNEALASYAVLSYLYFPPDDYVALRAGLFAAMHDGDAQPLLDLLDARTSRGPGGKYIDNSTDAFYAVTCLERPYNGTLDDVRKTAAEWSTTDPTFGSSFAWGMLPCAQWPATAPRVDSVTATTANPILLVSTTMDPATPHQWGLDMAKRIPGARLVTRIGTGHTGYGQGSGCVDTAVDTYLLSGALPPADQRCDTDHS